MVRAVRCHWRVSHFGTTIRTKRLYIVRDRTREPMRTLPRAGAYGWLGGPTLSVSLIGLAKAGSQVGRLATWQLADLAVSRLGS
jgi:hypothetical protein